MQIFYGIPISHFSPYRDCPLGIYDDNKNIIEECVLNPLEGKYGYHIPKGVWYGVEVLAPNTVMFEVKDGPYRPLEEEDILK